MEDLAPKPWDELFQIFNHAKNPLASANYWINEAKFSSLFPVHPDFDKLISFLSSLVPLVDADTNRLEMVPRMVSYDQVLQRNILCFLATHSGSMSAVKVKDFSDKCQRCYSYAKNDSLLYYLSLIKGAGCSFARDSTQPSVQNLVSALRNNTSTLSADNSLTEVKSQSTFLSKYTQTFLSRFSNHTKTSSSSRENFSMPGASTKKRHLDEHEELVAAKKPCLDLSNTSPSKPHLEESASNKAETGVKANETVPEHCDIGETSVQQKDIDDLKSIVQSNNIDSYVGFAKGKTKNKLRQLFSATFPGAPPAEWVTNTLDHLIKSENPSEDLENMLNPVCLLTILGLKSAAPRKLIQTMQRVAKQFGCLLINELLSPLVLSSVVSTKVVSFVTNVSKNNLSSENLCTLVISALSNSKFAQENFDGLVTLVQGLVNLKFSPDEKCTSSFCEFVSRYGPKQTNSFAFVKALMAFLKKPNVCLSEVQVFAIREGLEDNQTSLKDACWKLLAVLE